MNTLVRLSYHRSVFIYMYIFYDFVFSLFLVNKNLVQLTKYVLNHSQEQTFWYVLKKL